MPKYKSKILQALHEDMSELHHLGFADDQTMREFDQGCLLKPDMLTPNEIQHIRLTTHLDPQYFANNIGVSKATVLNWESGKTKPSGVALKVLNLVKNKGLEALA